MTAYAIQYRDGAWQLDPTSWHADDNAGVPAFYKAPR